MSPNMEPVLWVNVALSIVRTVLVFLVSMSWIGMTPAQMDAALQAGGAVFLGVDLLANFWVRSRVIPTAKIEAAIKAEQQAARF